MAKTSRPARPHTLRIIGGTWRGRRIPVPDLAELRPTPDRVRETVFNWLAPAIGGARCLDLFAGTGALGLEALSRGARSALFVERSAPAARNLREQIERLGAEARAEVRCADAFEFLRDDHTPFDLVFLDPPFRSDLLERCLTPLAVPGRLAPAALVYLESASSAGAPALPAGWELLRSKIAGEVGYHLARIPA
ncbi:MAG: 16S rRNA (guanine(966)-N(2))-methyltransferase RsmD [Gammaproteobacteria bacterium]|nr:16S rRNA (guanine(966)-N(2))-methyltransferase RsmD [Gammaproteobacteria bacterium]